MRLSKIKLAGFKSFVDPTTLDLVSNLTAIVGPNGCGKSNIIDAIRWVMGESSAKNLRGGALTDVIFNGSSGRKPVGQASVELVFDNSDGTLGGEYAGFSEIALKRSVTRDGDSAYFINGQRARKKDITGLFLGTGLGPRSYAIIEQGMISRVIEAKPEDMRQFIEEAAGISKYKERRRETENRIRHTQENLSRLSDLRLELEKQLANLEKQAIAAREYQSLKDEQKTVEVELLAMSWQRLDQDIKTAELKISALATTLEKHQAEITALRAASEEAREVQIERNDYLNEVQRQFYSIGTEIATIEQSLENIATQIQGLLVNQKEEEAALAQAKLDLVKDKDKAIELEGIIEALLPEVESSEAIVLESTAQLESHEMGLEEARAEAHQVQQSLSRATQNAQKEKTTIEHVEQRVQQSRTRHEKLIAEEKTLSHQSHEVDTESLESELKHAELKKTQIEETLQQQRSQETTVKAQIQDLKNEIKQTEKERQSLKDQLTTAQAIQAVKLGKENDQIEAWVQAQGLSEHPRLAEVIQVTSGWEKAIETLLSERLNAIYIDKDTFIQLLQKTELNQAYGLGLTVSDAHQTTTIGHQTNSILSKIENPEKLNSSLRAQLSQIRVIDTLGEGLAALETLDPTQSLMTREGIWLGQGWLKLPEALDKDEAGVLENAQRIKDLSATYESKEAHYKSLNEQLEQIEASLQALAQSISEAFEVLSSQKQKIFSTQSEIKVRKNKQEQTQRRRDQIADEIREIESQNQEAYQTIQKAREKLQVDLEEMAAQHEALESVEAKIEHLEALRKDLKQKLQTGKEQHHQLALKVQAAQSEFKALGQSNTRLEEQIQKSQERLLKIEQNIENLKTPEPKLREDLEGALTRRLESEEMLNQARDRLHESENQLKIIEREGEAIQGKIEDIRSEREGAKMNWQAFKVHFDSVCERIQHYEMAVDAVLQTLSSEANEPEWQERLDKIDKKIQRLGAINLTAIEEHAHALERKTYLDAQDEDLNKALATLDSAIQKIDKETRDRFKETFDKINKGFQNLFPRLFGGGESSIILTGDDLLNTGVTVMARPPGKKNASIQLLSGGEKALSAVAFVFSIFLLNPAPFCLLDEVDAPLDDTNVGRFCKLVKEMSEYVQFIFISHNKIAIEMGEQLHGVTMREAGVSRLVSVDINEAVRMAG